MNKTLFILAVVFALALCGSVIALTMHGYIHPFIGRALAALSIAFLPFAAFAIASK